MKSVLFLATYDMTVPGTGSSIRGASLLKYLAKHYEVHLLFMEGFGHDPRRSNIRQKAFIPHQVKSVARIPYSDKGFFIYDAGMYRQAAGIVERERIDFVFADFSNSGLYARMLKRRYGIPYIYSTHNVEYKRYIDFGKKDWRRFPLIPYVYWWERTACTDALLTVAITEDDGTVFTHWTDKVMTIPGGFDETVMNPFYEDPPTEPPVVLFVGNYNNPGNRQAVYVARERIVDKVLQEIPETRFQFVGANPPQDIDHPSMEFPGFVEDVMSYWQRANLVMVPVLEGGGMRIKTIEALACGKPVVSTAKGMEGVPPDMPGVSIADIADFPRAVIEAIHDGRSVYRDRYDQVAALFSEGALMGRLHDRIEEGLLWIE